jgi:hypothetical protein
MRRLSLGWQLTKKSSRLLADHPSLLVFPFVSAVAGVLSAVIIFGSALHYGWGMHSWQVYGVLAAIAYPFQFIETFVGVAFVAMARRALDGEPVTARAGLRCALSRVWVIAAWAAVATGIGLILRALENVRGGWLVTRLAAFLLGLVWAAATFFIVPVIALDGAGPIESLRRSGRTFKDRWGEGVTGATAVAAFTGLVLMIPCAILGFAGVATYDTGSFAVVFVIAVAVLVFLISASTALSYAFRVVLYRYATTGEVAGSFTESELGAAFKPRHGLT